MSKLSILAMAVILALSVGTLGVASAADVNDTYETVFKCFDTCNKCVDKCQDRCTPKCQDKCGQCDKREPCKPKCETKCDKCQPCKPKCETKCDKCEPCKPSCKQETCTPEPCEEKCNDGCWPSLPTEYPDACPVGTGEFDRNGMSRRNA